MNTRAIGLFCVCGFVVVLAGCSSDPAQPAVTVVTPAVVLDAPAPLAPLSGASSPTGWPTFTVTNATKTGAVGPVSYRFEVSTSSGFGTVAVSATVPETPATTSFTPGLNQIPPSETALFWRVTALDTTSNTASSPSAVQNVTVDFRRQVRLAAEENRALWPGEQPPAGSYGHVKLGARWEVQIRSTPTESFLSPTIEALQLIDLIDRGLNPADAIVWQGSHGYSTAQAVYYPDVAGGVVGYNQFYIALAGDQWDITVRVGA